MDEQREHHEQAQVARLISRRVRQARADRKLSRRRLAEIAGVSERYLSQLESEEANASIAILIRVAQALELDFRDLLAPHDADTGSAHDHAGGSRIGEGSPAESPSGDAYGPVKKLVRLAQSLSAHEAGFILPKVESELVEFRKSRRGIALLGLRGAGKSTIGRALAVRHGLPFISITREVEARAGMSLNELFSLGGPDAYRILENEVVDAVTTDGKQIVLETSGGIVGNSEALERILASFKTVWLKAEPEDHLARVARQGDVRPMQGNPRALEQLKALLQQRAADYARAELALDTTGKSVAACVADLERMAGFSTPVANAPANSS